MSKPLNPGKKPVALNGGARVSRIRRDPPPKAKEISVSDLEERDARIVAVGVVAFAIAIVAIIIGFASWTGWSPSQHRIHIVDGS